MVVVAALAFAVWYYYTHDPSAGFGPKCTFRLLTGYDCPGCGSQRAFHALLHGHVAQAWSFNPLVFFAVPAAVYFTVIELGRRRWPRLYAASMHPAIIIVIFVSIVAFWIGRNLSALGSSLSTL